MVEQSRENTPTYKSLSPAAVWQFQQEGYFAPLRIMPSTHAAALRAQLERYESSAGGPLSGHLRHKSHLLFTWLWDLVFDPRILDAVEDLLGKDLLCWSSSFFIKEAHDPGFVSWHQDATYWGLSSPDVVTVWVALSPSTLASGAMRVLPGSHREQFAHRDTFAEHNLLTRGQEVAVEVDGTRAVPLLLSPGEVSLHHVLIVHGSEPNRADDRRIGYAIRYVPTHVRQIAGASDSATLVRGEDRYRHFAQEQPPEYDMSPAAVERHATITAAQAATLYRGTGKARFRA